MKVKLNSKKGLKTSLSVLVDKKTIQKKLDEKMKLRRQQNKERMDELKKRYQQPRPIFGRPKGEFTIKGGAGPRGKQLKRI